VSTTFFLYPLFEQGFLNFLVLCLLGWARFVLHGVLLCLIAYSGNDLMLLEIGRLFLNRKGREFCFPPVKFRFFTCNLFGVGDLQVVQMFQFDCGLVSE